MPEQRKTLIPLKDKEITGEEMKLMLLLNEQVCALFDEEDIILKPSPEMNSERRWAYLRLVKQNPQARVGYWFGNRTCADSDGYVWLNVELHLWITGEDGKENIAPLTPNQTHWILDKLKANTLLRDTLDNYLHDSITNLEDSLGRLRQIVDVEQYWDIKGKNNPVFDSITANSSRRGSYTSWDIFMVNVCPSPPWLSPLPQIREAWRGIKEIGDRSKHFG